jgi:hypothetical protein
MPLHPFSLIHSSCGYRTRRKGIRARQESVEAWNKHHIHTPIFPWSHGGSLKWVREGVTEFED